MRSKEYYDVRKKQNMVTLCYPNEHFPSTKSDKSPPSVSTYAEVETDGELLNQKFDASSFRNLIFGETTKRLRSIALTKNGLVLCYMIIYF